jgi:8-oxo-dGTP pyrophosphatase MutT (NUDIX family)
MVVIEKVVAYATQGDMLLVFTHPAHPDAGIQVPAGTIEHGESPDEAVLREFREETGLSDPEIRSYLGTKDYDMSPFGRSEIHRRHFYHIALLEATPSGWTHYETSGGLTAPIEFRFFWAQLPDRVPRLIAGQGDLLGNLNLSG